MIMSVAELREYINSAEEDKALEAKLQALELLVRAHTNNNFQIRALRVKADAVSSEKQMLINEHIPFVVGDTLQISGSAYMLNELVTVKAVSDGVLTVNEPIEDEHGVVLTKVKYPKDVQMGVVNLLKWDIDNREKVGVSSETISRHSVTYFDLTGDNSSMGYPKALMGFLKPYYRARFGGG